MLYHGEGEWTGECIFSHAVGHVLSDAQMEYDYIPQDVFAKPAAYHTCMQDKVLKVNTQEYKIVIVPTMQFITKAFAEAILEMRKNNISVIFIDKYPEGTCDELAENNMKDIRNSQVVSLAEIKDVVKALGAVNVSITPANNRIRYYQYEHKEGMSVYLFVNEGIECYQGKVQMCEERKGYIYDAWNNIIYQAAYAGNCLEVQIEPLKSLIVVFDDNISIEELGTPQKAITFTDKSETELKSFDGPWKRSTCKSVDYPNFDGSREVSIPDNLAEEQPKFSGVVRYENTFTADKDTEAILEITDAHEGVEVFINGTSVGIQIVPPFLYDITKVVQEGKNQIAIIVGELLYSL